MFNRPLNTPTGGRKLVNFRPGSGEDMKKQTDRISIKTVGTCINCYMDYKTYSSKTEPLSFRKVSSSEKGPP